MEDPLIECIHVPKLLFTDLKYRWMSDFSKLLYSLLMEQSRQSVQRGWVDSNKNIYVVFPKSELRLYLNVSANKLNKAFYELEECAKLVKITYPKPGQAGRIYLRNVVAESRSR